MELISACIDKDSKLFKNIWNETVRIRKQITPFVSQNGLCFTLANAFDNIENVGLSYLIREYEKQTLMTFLVEIMNIFLDQVENCYYRIDESKHVYYNATNDDFIRDMAEDTDWDFNKLGTPDSRFDLDCNPNKYLEIAPDWGSTINLFTIGQERNFDFVTREAVPTDNFINEFFAKPDTSKGVMINDLVDSFVKYYRFHNDKTVFFYRDRYGDHRNPNVKNARSYNDQAVARLQKNGWTVISKTHKGMEPPQHDKFLLWGNILLGTDPNYPRVRFNGTKCKYTLISMNNTEVIESEGKFKKNKSSERSKTILPEQATHFSDAVDKRMWTKYGHLLKVISTFIPARI